VELGRGCRSGHEHVRTIEALRLGEHVVRLEGGPSNTLSMLPSASRLRFDPYIWNHTWVLSSMHSRVCTDPAGS
jgi:hypothetical protein